MFVGSQNLTKFHPMSTFYDIYHKHWMLLSLFRKLEQLNPKKSHWLVEYSPSVQEIAVQFPVEKKDLKIGTLSYVLSSQVEYAMQIL